MCSEEVQGRSDGNDDIERFAIVGVGGDAVASNGGLDSGSLLPSLALVRCGTKRAGTQALERGWKVPKFKEVGGEEVATLFTAHGHASEKL